jgi:hypothetical protein
MSNPVALTEKPPTSPEHIAVLLKHADLQLPEAYLAELIEAYGYVERMVGRIHRGRDRADEAAHVYNPRTFEPKAKVPA